MADSEGQTLQNDWNWSKIVGQAHLPILGGQTLDQVRRQSTISSCGLSTQVRASPVSFIDCFSVAFTQESPSAGDETGAHYAGGSARARARACARACARGAKCGGSTDANGGPRSDCGQQRCVTYVESNAQFKAHMVCEGPLIRIWRLVRGLPQWHQLR